MHACGRGPEVGADVCEMQTSDDIIFIGKEGVLLSGPRSRELEAFVVKYSSLMVCLSSFVEAVAPTA